MELNSIKCTYFHEKYLGFPTMTGRNKKLLFKRVQERLDAHLCGWQSKFLSKAGKVVLVKAVAQAIPSYAIMCSSCQKEFAKLSVQKLLDIGGVKGMEREGFIGANGICCVNIRILEGWVSEILKRLTRKCWQKWCGVLTLI